MSSQPGKRSHEALPFHLIPTIAQELEAERFAYGKEKYGVANWCYLSKEQFIDAWNHMYEHMLKFRDGIEDDNIPGIITHLGAIRFNAGIIAWGLSMGKVAHEDFAKCVGFPGIYSAFAPTPGNKDEEPF